MEQANILLAAWQFLDTAPAESRLRGERKLSERRVDKSLPISNLLRSLSASVAQLVEQLTLNQLVLGSSPSRGTTLFWGIFPFQSIEDSGAWVKRSQLTVMTNDCPSMLRQVYFADLLR